jgi:hypothetical protein
VLDGIAEHCVLADDALRRQWQRQDKLAGWRDYDRLIAVLPVETDEFAPDESDGDEGDAVMGIPIWDEGVLAQASLSTVRQAVHLCRYLDDYHEPTIAALRRSYLRRANTDDPAARMVACAAAAEAFLENPVTWRMVVVQNSARVAVRAVEAVLGQRIPGSGRTLDQLHAKIVDGCRQLRLADHQAVATTILQGCMERARTIDAAQVMLFYEEHAYLHLTGIQDNRSIRRHLARGLHLAFSDQEHRRADRSAHHWIATSQAADQAGAFHWAPAIPPAYAAARRSDVVFRVADPAAVRRYAQEGGE